MHDLVIRGGVVVDGTGEPPRQADVAIDGGIITHVGRGAGRGVEEIDATGAIVTPGFVDIHTHYDAQATWDPILAPSALHGVTSVVMGNCAVGFAPARPDGRPWLVNVMEAVEEIPEAVMDAGLDWDWETYPQYLDALDRRKHTIDIGSQAPHIALRAYVMGDRANTNEPATPAETAAMSALVEEALRAGALGLSCSRTDGHKMSDGRVVPGAYADAEEVLTLSEALGRVGNRVMQYLGNHKDLDRDIPMMWELARRSRSPVHFIMSANRWRQRLAAIDTAEQQGLKLYGHVAPRAQGMSMHWRSAGHLFTHRPSIKAIAHLPWEAKFERLKDPAFKAQVLSETDTFRSSDPMLTAEYAFDGIFEMADYPDYEPDPRTDSIAARAAKVGQDPAAYAYDVFMRRNGEGMILAPIANYAAGDLSEVLEILRHPGTVVSLADGGAHCTRVCDAATPTFMLMHWARDRVRGEKLPLEKVVKSLTMDPASSYGLNDRGRLVPGYLADLNVIDFDRLRLPAPYLSFDLPAGGLRLLQNAEGYLATVKRGQATFRDGEHCGLYPGQVIRGPQQPRA